MPLPTDIPCDRLYADLAFLWPLLSPPEEYAEEAAVWRDLLRERLGPGRHALLELGVGGGHNLSHFAGEFDVVAIDRSEPMLDHSRRLNPGVEHVAGDMRTIRLGRTFDAVLIHDAVSCLTTGADLAATFATAAAHLEPGGLFIVAPDDYRETFIGPRMSHLTRQRGDTHLVSIEYIHDPDPADSMIEVIYTHFISEAGDLRIEHDRMITGLFPRGTWLTLLDDAGLDAEERRFPLAGKLNAYGLLVARKR